MSGVAEKACLRYVWVTAQVSSACLRFVMWSWVFFFVFFKIIEINLKPKAVTFLFAHGVQDVYACLILRHAVGAEEESSRPRPNLKVGTLGRAMLHCSHTATLKLNS